MADIEDLPGIPDEKLLPEVHFDDGKIYAEDAIYALRFRYATEDGIVREYGIRRSDNKLIVINIREVAPLLKKQENSKKDIV